MSNTESTDKNTSDDTPAYRDIAMSKKAADTLPEASTPKPTYRTVAAQGDPNFPREITDRLDQRVGALLAAGWVLRGDMVMHTSGPMTLVMVQTMVRPGVA